MRFFKRKGDDDVAQAARTYVDGDVVYDEAGEVIFDPSIEAEALKSAGHMETIEAEDTLDVIAAYDALNAQAEAAIAEADAEAATAKLEVEAQNTQKPEVEDTVVDTPQDYDSTFEIDMEADFPAMDVSYDKPSAPVEPDLLHRRVNLGEIRMDVARITSDIQSGERLYQRAQQRVESLVGFVERAEVDFSLLNRLEPENRRLKARNRVLEAETESANHTERRLRNELTEAVEQLEAARADIDAQGAKLRAMTSHLSKRDAELKAMTQEMEEAALRMERTQTSVEVESRENVILREQITELSTRMDEVTAERMELAKIVESLKIDCDDFRAQKVQAQTEVSDLRVALATAQKVNGEMKTRMMGLHDEIKGFKTQYEFNVISRDDRIENLESRVGDLTKQLRIKEDVAKSALRDAAQLRKARSSQDVERERLERVIETQQRQLEEANLQISRSTASMAELDERYNDVAAALSVHQKRLTPGAKAAAPLSDPPPFQDSHGKLPSPPPRQTSNPEDDSLTPQNVEDLITDYKLGLRSSIG